VKEWKIQTGIRLPQWIEFNHLYPSSWTCYGSQVSHIARPSSCVQPVQEKSAVDEVELLGSQESAGVFSKGSVHVESHFVVFFDAFVDIVVNVLLFFVVIAIPVTSEDIDANDLVTAVSTP
jgi:hypothetical protein